MRALALALLVGGCGDSDPARVFELTVAPVLETSCGSTACHGVALDAEARGEVIPWDQLAFRVDEGGKIVDLEQARDAALRAVNTVDEPQFSSLVRKPLSESYGGTPHYGLENFPSTSDPAYLDLLEWIALEPSGGEDPTALTSEEQRFADEIQPILSSMSCMSGNCHGPSAAVPYRFDSGMGGEFSTEGSRHNYDLAVEMLSLDGEPEQSRLLRKSLPLHDGGIVHKGGNGSHFLGRSDARYLTMLDWACDEQQRRTGIACEADRAPISGFVFVQGPITPQNPFDLDQFDPGTDLMLATVSGDLQVDEVVNLTGHLHDQPADIRDPAVDPTGTRVAFSMRLSQDVGHEIWELDLQTLEATAITQGAVLMEGGGLLTNRDPTYGADGLMYFVSTRAGWVADRGQWLDADVYQIDLATGAVTRRTATPHVERKPVWFTAGHGNAQEIAFTALRDALSDRQRRAHSFRFPPGLSAEYHQHFGISTPENLVFDTRELPDGRYLAVLGDLDNPWLGGELAVVERNFGPEFRRLRDGGYGSSGLPFYRPPVSRLGHEAMYRDPVGLPDGRVLVAATDGAFDPADGLATPHLSIQLLSLGENVRGGGAEIVASSILVADGSLSSFDPEPIFTRFLPEDSRAFKWDPTAQTGKIHHQGMPTIDGLIGNVGPSGPKRGFSSFAFVRLVEAVPMTVNQREPVDPAETRNGQLGATTTSLGTHGPARILAELPVAADGTFQAEIPAGVSVRIQGLDENRMARGNMHNRWFDVNPGQVIPQGVQAEHYEQLCGACHGGLNGEPEGAFVEPDVVTTASLTLSRYERQNPRRPIPAPLTGDATRIEVDFATDIHPIIERSCVPCHSGSQPEAGLDLSVQATEHYSVAYESLLAPGYGSTNHRGWVDDADGSAFGSRLLERLMGLELGAPGRLEEPHEAHPGGEYALTESELLTIIRWVDLGAIFVGSVEAR